MKNKRFMVVVFSVLALLAFVYAVNAAQPNVVLKNGHIPTNEGIKQAWFTNTANVAVHLSFAGPWDFTSGPKQKSFTEKWIQTKDAFNGNQFPDATCAVERTKAGQKAYYFYKKMKNGLYWLGCSSPPSNPDISNFSYAPAIRTLLFPAKVGGKLSQNSTIVSGGGNSPFTMNLKIVGKGTVIVAAGTFNDAVMVQSKLVLSGDPPFLVYQWFAPYVGMVAEIWSLDGETNELFTTASEFSWLKSCAVP